MKDLEKYIKESRDSREVKRAIAVKMVLEEYSYEEICKLLGVGKPYISIWKNKYLEAGVKGLNLGYKGFTPYLTQQQREEVINKLREKNYWNLEELIKEVKEKYGVEYKSLQSYYELFHEAKISWKKSQKVNPKEDPEEVELKKKR